MTAILIGDGPCWRLTHQDPWESWEHFDSEREALMELAREIDREIDAARGSHPGPAPTATALMVDPHEEDLGELLGSKAVRETTQCTRIRCDSCGVEADWEDGSADRGSHFFIDDLHQVADWGWQSSGDWDSCPECPVPEEAVRAHEEEMGRRPGPNDVPLFDIGGGS